MIKKTVLILVAALPLTWVASILFMAFHVSVYGTPYQKAYEAIVQTDHIDLALTKLLSDTGRSSLRALFDQDAFEEVCAWHMAEHGTSEFEVEIALYSRGLHALLRYGHHAQTTVSVPGDKQLEGGPSRSADGVVGVGPVELNPRIRQPVDIGRLALHISVTRQGLRREFIGNCEEHIRPDRLCVG